MRKEDKQKVFNLLKKQMKLGDTDFNYSVENGILEKSEAYLSAVEIWKEAQKELLDKYIKYIDSKDLQTLAQVIINDYQSKGAKK